MLGGGEGDAVRVAAVAVRGVGAKRGDFDLARGARAEHGDHAERRADRQRAAAAEEVANLVGRGAGGDVVVFRREAEQLIADAAAGPQRFEAGGAELVDDFEGEVALGVAEGMQGSGFRVQSCRVNRMHLLNPEPRTAERSNRGDCVVDQFDCAAAGGVVPGEYVFDAGAEEVEGQLDGRPAESAFGGHGVDVHLHFVLLARRGRHRRRRRRWFCSHEVPVAVRVLVEAIDEAVKVADSRRPGEEEFGFAVQDGRLGQLWRARRGGESLDQFAGVGGRSLRI